MDENKNMDWKTVPVYKDSPAAARKKNELDVYQASSAANAACAKEIKEMIKENWTGSSLKEGSAQRVMDTFGPDRLVFVLANTVQLRAYDTRFSRDTRAWAQIALGGADEIIPEEKRIGWEIESHSVLLNDFVGQAREAIETLTMLETPVYHESYQYAVDNQETDPYWESYACNRDCRHAIEEAIADHYDGYRMDGSVSDGVLKKYGEQRTMYVIANTIQLLQGDGRISQQNAHWAKREPIPNETAQDQSLRRDFLVRSHPGLFNLFANITRNAVIQAQLARREQQTREQDQPSILAQLEKPLTKASNEKRNTKKKEQVR